MNKFHVDLDKGEANHRPLTPLHFLIRAGEVYPDRIAVIYGDMQRTWKQHSERCQRLASALINAGIQKDDTVSVFSVNTPAMLEAQFGVPLAGAVLNCLNSRLDAAGVAFILRHAESRVLIVDQQFAAIAREALKSVDHEILVIDSRDPAADELGRAGTITYEDFLEAGDLDTPLRYPNDEWDAISLNYTSGTTGDPKGVVYHHRGAYLNAVGQTITAQMTSAKPPVYLWTLPLFHCNGWCFPWALAAIGATQICMRKVAAETIYPLIEKHGVTLFCGAPTVLQFLADAPATWKKPATPIRVMSGGSSPPAPMFKRLHELGFDVVHLYGMTEMHGVATVCEEQALWNDLEPDARITHLQRQGVRSPMTDQMIVANPTTLEPVPRDGKTVGEILFRGSIGMKGYLKNPRATNEAFAGGWYHTGDLAVVHEDGYIEIKDRSKDIIISGGENISSIEVEETLYAHPAVASVAVVAVPDARWGETPCAIIELKPGAAADLTAADFIQFCRQRLAAFKCPRHVIFSDLPRTATGKLQKFKLRDFAAQTITKQ